MGIIQNNLCGQINLGKTSLSKSDKFLCCVTSQNIKNINLDGAIHIIYIYMLYIEQFSNSSTLSP